MEVILTLFAWKLAFPNHMHLARGNHEARNINSRYGFKQEVIEKYDEQLYELFCEAFCLLPLCHVINRQVFVVHGGLFMQDNVTLDDIRQVNRECEPPQEGLMAEMLWSDPQPARGRALSKRNVGAVFGPDVTKNFLKVNNLKMVIRSHQAQDLASRSSTVAVWSQCMGLQGGEKVHFFAWMVRRWPRSIPALIRPKLVPFDVAEELVPIVLIVPLVATWCAAKVEEMNLPKGVDRKLHAH